MFNTDLTRLETEKLIECVRKTGENIYIEIGVFEGGTLKKVLEQTKAYCIGVDLFEDFVVNNDNTHVTGTISRQSLREALEQHFRYTRFELFKLDSKVFFKSLVYMSKNKETAVVFIDGNHKYQACMDDVMGALSLISKGYIILHNASNTWEPDTWYIAADGGPYQVTQDLIARSAELRLTYEGTFDRSSIFKVG
jgi:hypothetical protein